MEDNYNNEVDSDQVKILSNDIVQCNDKSVKCENSKLLNLLLIFTELDKPFIMRKINCSLTILAKINFS